MSEPQPFVDKEILDGLEGIVESLQNQDNRATANPVFCVMQKRQIYGFKRGYSDDIERCTDEDGKVRKVRYQDIDEFVTACLTEKGCKDYIKINGHNLNSPFVYVHGGRRNHEWEFLRNALPVLLNAIREAK